MATILVIEDQEPVRALLRRALEGAGHEVLEASNGRLGLALYRASAADLVITDIVMPEMDGLEMMLELTWWRCYAARGPSTTDSPQSIQA